MNNPILYSQYIPELKEASYLINFIYVSKYEKDIIYDISELYVISSNEWYIYRISKSIFIVFIQSLYAN